MKVFDTVGDMIFFAGVHGITNITRLRKFIMKVNDTDNQDEECKVLNGCIDRMYQYEVYNISDGIEFFQMIEEGRISNENVILHNVFIYNYNTNLGLVHKGFCQGDLLVCGEIWLDLCTQADIRVNWESY